MCAEATRPEAPVPPVRGLGYTVPTMIAAAGGLIAAGGLASALGAGATAATVTGILGGAVVALGQLHLTSLRRLRREAADQRRVLSAASGACLWTLDAAGPVGRGDEAVTLWLADEWRTTFDIPAGVHGSTRPWFERVHPQDLGPMVHSLERVRAGHERALRRQYRMVDGDEHRWFELHARLDDERGFSRLIGSVQDATESHHTRERLAHTAFHDPLTGLPNRALFLDRLSHCTARARRNPHYRFAVVFLDIDDFKLINDSLGHHAGDILLGIVAGRLQRGARPGDTVARMGGDEFTILLDPIERSEDVEKVTARLRSLVHGEVDVLGHRTRISTSVGIALSSPDYTEALELLRDADTAMYHAKRLGSGKQQLFDQAMRASVVRRLEVETELRAALAGEGARLLVHYQPVISLGDGGIEGFEALVRLEASSGGLISPGEFIPLAETQGFIDAILDHVLEDACAMASRWAEHIPDLYVSVNVSARSVHAGLVDRIGTALTRHDLAARHLKLELTESVLVGTANVVSETLAELRARGLGLFIDDFGTGFSSLSYLHQFPADRIKLDRTFVMALDGLRTPEIVETIVSLSRRIGAAVIAEGIETETQLRALRALGCRSGQGYFFAPGVPADKAEGLVTSGRQWRVDEERPVEPAAP